MEYGDFKKIVRLESSITKSMFIPKGTDTIKIYEQKMISKKIILQENITLQENIMMKK